MRFREERASIEDVHALLCVDDVGQNGGRGPLKCVQRAIKESRSRCIEWRGEYGERREEEEKNTKREEGELSRSHQPTEKGNKKQDVKRRPDWREYFSGSFFALFPEKKERERKCYVLFNLIKSSNIPESNQNVFKNYIAL